LAANMNMQISSIENYQNGQLHGQLTKFRDKSSIESFSDSVEYIANYKNGTLHGHYEKHSLDGTITISGNYSFGKKEGQWKETDSIDNTTWITEYRENFYNGKREQFDTQGRKLCSYNYSYNQLDGIQIKYNLDGTKSIEETFEHGKMNHHIEYADNNRKQYEIDIKNQRSTYFDALNTYYTDYDNAEVSKTIIVYQYNIVPDNVLTKVFNNNFNNLNKIKNGIYQVYDRQNRIIVDGMYLNGKKSLVWTYTFYNQNLYYNESYDSPLKFYTLDTKQPYSGKFVRTENKNGPDLTATYKIKKSLIEEIIYSDITTGKTVFKEKFKDGLKKTN
jgi:antitoxin component YwqK of YwqJK toxin-antitoxin module